MTRILLPSFSFVLCFGGCSSRFTVAEGTVYESHLSTAPPMPGAEVRVQSLEGELLLETTTNEQGRFTGELPLGTDVIAEVSGSGLALIGFPGTTGFGDKLVIEDRSLFAFSVAEKDAIRAAMAGCPGADDPDASLVVGEIRVYGLEDPESGESPTISNGRASATAGGQEWTACYWNADGTAYDPLALSTGLAGSFVIFGVEPGLGTLTVEYEALSGSPYTADYPLWIAEGDAVSAWYPAWVEWAF